MDDNKPVVLVVDDEQDLLETITELLMWDDYKVVTATSGIEGIQRAMETQPNLIISDLQLPDLSGYEVLQAVRAYQATTNIPFIFLSGHADKDNKRKAIKLGADDYLVKPFTHSELLSLVKARLQRYADLQNDYEAELKAARKTFTQLVAHELRTPLISIVMVHDLITKKVAQMTPDQLSVLMETMGSGISRMRHLVEQMVYLNQIEMSILTEKIIDSSGVVVSLKSLLPEMMALGTQFTTRGKNIVTQLDDTLTDDHLILCDVTAIKHAVGELLSNALNFSPKANAVEFSAWAEGDQLYLKIVDHGAGISWEQIKQAQREFQQINREKQEQQGAGVGLSLAQKLIAIHGGTVNLTSSEGQGTEVLIQLPLYQGTIP